MKFKQVQVEDVDQLINDDNYIMQQKVDGNRATVVVKDGVAKVLGKYGQPVKSTTSGPTAERLVDEFAGLPDMLVHGEIIGDDYFIFDTEYGPMWESSDTFDTRWGGLVWWIDNYTLLRLKYVPAHTGTVVKQEAWERIVGASLEGAVFKNTISNQDPIKVKITHTVDCAVMERDTGGKTNAVLGLYDNGELKRIGQASMIGKPDAQVGDTVEVKYLYAGAGGRLVQPSVLTLRDDKPAEKCTFEQLVFVNKEVL